MTAPLLQMQGIVKTFPGTRACDGADLEVRAGEVHCLLGENGAGKSTLMKILAGSYQPDEGQILLDGKPTRFANPHDGLRAGINVIYQELDLIPDQSVAQNLFLGHSPSRLGVVNNRARRLMAAEALGRVGARFSPTAIVRNLSVADQQLTAIAKALTLDSKVLVMDEPSATLTDHDLRAVFDVVRSLAADGRAIIYISHRLPEVMEIGDRATVLRDGRRVATFQVAEIEIEDLVTAMIGRRPVAERRPRRSRQAGTPRLEIREVSIPGVLDVHDITVAPGEIVGLAGLGGAGRSTLLAAVFGARSAELDASVDGAQLRANRPAAAVRAGIGLVPEDRKGQGLLRELSVYRNAGLAALQPFGLWPTRHAAALAKGPLAKLGVRFASGSQLVGQLSGGNQQKVVLAKWIVRGVTLLLLDEPTRGLDIGAKADLFDQVESLTEQGVGVLLASSELSELTAHADRIWVMHEGRNIACFDPHEVSEETIARAVVTGMGDQG